ncbi:MAG: hypothetical protein ACMXYG_00325 [Candidatus Woesearchaeota archaeon]
MNTNKTSKRLNIYENSKSTLIDNQKKIINLRDKFSKRIINSEIPFIVYIVIFTAIAILWIFRLHIEDFAYDFIAELFGAAFTLFIIDVLLIKSKNKRWKIVRKDIDYLITKYINKLRDGLAYKVFKFKPVIIPTKTEKDNLQKINEERSKLLIFLSEIKNSEFNKKINKKELFTEETYNYFNQKADEIWEILNFKYSDYFPPQIVSYLIDLHVNLKDLCGHIKLYLRKYQDNNIENYYNKIGFIGASKNIKSILIILNQLKEEGYSESTNY